MPKSVKTKTRISVTIIPFVNQTLERVSKRTGLSKSLLVEKALKNFLHKQMEEDVKALSKLRFEDLPSENDWLMIQSEDN